MAYSTNGIMVDAKTASEIQIRNAQRMIQRRNALIFWLKVTTKEFEKYKKKVGPQASK